MRSTETMLSRTFEMMSPLRPSERRAARKPAARRVPARLGLEDVARQRVDALADRGQDFRGAVDDRLDAGRRARLPAGAGSRRASRLWS